MKPTCFYMSKATSGPQTNHSQCYSPVEVLNLIVESKSQPVELDNSTIELHVPSRRKKSLQSYCSVDFLAFIMRFDMTFDVTLPVTTTQVSVISQKRLIFTFTGNV